MTAPDLTPQGASAVRLAMTTVELRAEVARITELNAATEADRDHWHQAWIATNAACKRAEAQVTAVRAYANHQHNVVGALFSGPDVIAVMDEAKAGGS